MRFDTTLAKLKLGRNYYAIPVNHFDAPITSHGREGDFTLGDGFFLVGLYPDFEGRSKDNRKAFNEVGQSRQIYVLGSTGSPKPLVDQVRIILNLRLQNSTPTGPWQVQGDEFVVEISSAPDDTGSKLKDVFINTKDGSFTICTRAEMLEGWNRPRNPSCHSTFHDDNIYYEVSYTRVYMEQRDTIKRLILDKFAGWRVDRLPTLNP